MLVSPSFHDTIAGAAAGRGARRRYRAGSPPPGERDRAGSPPSGERDGSGVGVGQGVTELTDTG